MINNKKVLAIVPARGGSKGIPLKNLREINGKSLVAITADCIKNVIEIDRAIISTDYDNIAKEAEKFGLAAPFRRPEELSGDTIADWEVLRHSLKEIEEIDECRYDIIVMLQPTSPLREPFHVSKTIKKLIDDELDSCWTVSKTDLKYHPLKQLNINKNFLEPWDAKGAEIVTRQELKSVYHKNGIAYVMTRECILDNNVMQFSGTPLGNKAGAYLIEDHHISIDTEEDIDLVKSILNKNS
jgi:CMP-N,N'-diacetyllegionaminic acid synthase